MDSECCGCCVFRFSKCTAVHLLVWAQYQSKYSASHLLVWKSASGVIAVSAGTWQIEAVTGKGLHSVGNEPKLLPAVKQFLDSEGIPWWPGNPGMVVFQLNPEPEEF